MTILFRNSQWAVTKYGLETVKPEAPYLIEASSLTWTRDPQVYSKPPHMAEKNWVDLKDFNEAFSKALELLEGRYSPKADPKMLEASIEEAWRIRRELYGPDAPKARSDRLTWLVLG